MVVAHTAPPARSVTPAINITVSNRVISQLLRMARLNCWTVSGVGWPSIVNKMLISLKAPLGRVHGEPLSQPGSQFCEC